MPELIVIGGGEHSRVVIEAVRSHPEPWRIIGFVDPLPCRETVDRMQVERLGGNDAVASFPMQALCSGSGCRVATASAGSWSSGSPRRTRGGQP